MQGVCVGVVAVCVMEFMRASVGPGNDYRPVNGRIKTKVATRTIHSHEGFYTKTPKKEIRAWKRSKGF